MTKNANPKPFNISRLKCQRRKLGKNSFILGLLIIRLPSYWLNIIQIKKLYQ